MKYSLIGDFNQQQNPSHCKDQYAGILGTTQHTGDSLIRFLAKTCLVYAALPSALHLSSRHSVCPVNETQLFGFHVELNPANHLMIENKYVKGTEALLNNILELELCTFMFLTFQIVISSRNYYGRLSWCKSCQMWQIMKILIII